MKCVVLVVSGRPLNIAAIQAEANAIVASWLPGTEGEGVADTLFGDEAVHRPAARDLGQAGHDDDQLPINVGDKTYDPLYPYGWGLRTDPAEGAHHDRARRARHAAHRDGQGRRASS